MPRNSLVECNCGPESNSADNSPEQALFYGLAIYFNLNEKVACPNGLRIASPSTPTIIETTSRKPQTLLLRSSLCFGGMQTTLIFDDDIHEDTTHVGNTKKGQQHSYIPISASALVLSLLNLQVPLKPIPRIFATASLLVSLLAFILATRGRPSSTALALFSVTATFVAYSTHFVRAPIAATPVRIPSIFEMPSHENFIPRPSGSNFSRPMDALKAVEKSQASHPHAGDAETEFLENALDETRSLPLPPGANGTYIVNTHAGESCSSACTRYDYKCAPKKFAAVNLCALLTVRLGCDGCKAVAGSHRLAAALPSAEGDGDRKRCLSLDSTDLEAAQCHASYPGVQRLCPCAA